MQYIAAVSGNGAGVERVKNVIIEARRWVQSERWQCRHNINMLLRQNASAKNIVFYFHSKTHSSPQNQV
jgi:hypothetical protein